MPANTAVTTGWVYGSATVPQKMQYQTLIKHRSKAFAAEFGEYLVNWRGEARPPQSTIDLWAEEVYAGSEQIDDKIERMMLRQLDNLIKTMGTAAIRANAEFVKTITGAATRLIPLIEKNEVDTKVLDSLVKLSAMQQHAGNNLTFLTKELLNGQGGGGGHMSVGQLVINAGQPRRVKRVAPVKIDGDQIIDGEVRELNVG